MNAEQDKAMSSKQRLLEDHLINVEGYTQKQIEDLTLEHLEIAGLLRDVYHQNERQQGK